MEIVIDYVFDTSQEDKENMQKEVAFWRSEASKWEELLAKETRANSLLEEDPSTSLESQINRHRKSIAQLQQQVLLNSEKIEGMANLVIGDL